MRLVEEHLMKLSLLQGRVRGIEVSFVRGRRVAALWILGTECGVRLQRHSYRIRGSGQFVVQPF